MSELVELDFRCEAAPGRAAETLPAAGRQSRDVDLMTAVRMIESLPDLVILDVRMPVEHAEHRIQDSINLDFYADDFEHQLAQFDRQASYLVYCRSGGRSAFTLDIMQDLGFIDFAHMPVGIEGWIQAGFPVQTE